MEKTDKYSLIDGSIGGKLFFVALPLIGTQIIQMAYNLTDMFWLGRLSSDSVAASGTVGLFLWLSMAFMLFGRMGAEIGVSQNLGRGDRERALSYARASIITAVVLGAVIALAYGWGRSALIGFFNIQEANVEQDAVDYLGIISIGVPFSFLASAVSGVFSGAGNTRISLIINGVGLALNMFMDPLLIFNAGMGIQGAAIATVAAQAVAACLSLLALFRYKSRPFEKVSLLERIDVKVLKQIFGWVTPISVESFLFTFLSMIVAALIATYGAGAMAASRVSTQIESLNWLIAGGFGSALTAFTGQNYGAGRWARIHRGFKISSGLMVCWGALLTALFYFGGRAIFSLFIPDDRAVVDVGVQYLGAMALVQIPSCLEGVAAGVFRGQGKTVQPSVSSVTANTMRVVLAFILARLTPLGLSGVWVAMAVGAGARGALVYVWYLFYRRKTAKM